jgi:hypothetical protein
MTESVLATAVFTSGVRHGTSDEAKSPVIVLTAGVGLSHRPETTLQGVLACAISIGAQNQPNCCVGLAPADVQNLKGARCKQIYRAKNTPAVLFSERGCVRHITRRALNGHSCSSSSRDWTGHRASCSAESLGGLGE